MTSRERVITTIAHQEPDRVPTGEHGIDHDHVTKILGRHTYWRNRKDTTIALWEGRRDEVVESMKYDYEELVKKLDYDIVTVELVPPKGFKHPDPPKRTGDGVWEDSRGNIFKYSASNDSIVCVSHKEGKEILSEEDLLSAASRNKMDDSMFELIDYFGDKYGTEKAVLCRSINIYDILMEPFGGDYTHHLVLTSIAPEEIKKMYQIGLQYNREIIEHCGKHNVLLAAEGHDFGMNTGCILSPLVIRDLFFPFMNMINREIEKNGMMPFFHCCGKIWDILDDFVEAGYKGYQSIQSSAGMDIVTVKDKYGKDLTLWAGIQCETLIAGTIEETVEEVEKSLKVLMPGGGFIFGSTNTVQYGANTYNYLKALDVVHKQGIYR